MTDLTLDAYRSLPVKNIQETLRKERAKIFTSMTEESIDLSDMEEAWNRCLSKKKTQEFGSINDNHIYVRSCNHIVS